MYIIVYHCISLYIIVYPYVICPETYKIRITSIKITWHPKGFPQIWNQLDVWAQLSQHSVFFEVGCKKRVTGYDNQQFDRDLAIAND